MRPRDTAADDGFTHECRVFDGMLVEVTFQWGERRGHACLDHDHERTSMGDVKADPSHLRWYVQIEGSTSRTELDKSLVGADCVAVVAALRHHLSHQR